MRSVKDNLKNLETLLNVLSELNESYQTNFEPKLLSELANTILTYHEHQFGTWNPQIMESHEVKEMLGSFLKEIEPQVKEELLKSKVKWEEKVKKINSEQIAWNELIDLGNQKERNANEVNKIEELIGRLTFLGLNHKPSFKRSINEALTHDPNAPIQDTIKHYFEVHKSNCEKELVLSFETPIVKKIYSLAQSENFALDLATKHFESYVMRYKENLQNAKKSLSMIHMYEQNIGARGSEYLNSYASDNEEDDHISFDKTNHGIGSGVYGLSHSQKSFAEMKQSVRDMKETYKSKYEIVEIEKPLHLHDAEGDKLSKLSKGLQRIGDQVHKLQTESRKLKKVPDNRLAILESNMDIQNELKVHAKTLKELTALKDFNLTDDDSYKILSQSLQQFLLDSKKSDHPIVAMPINYVISHLGFTGVVGEGNDTFSRGLISMKHSLPTVPIKVPTDTEKKILRENMEKYPADSKHLAKITYEKDTISNKIEESDFLSEENNVTQKETLPQNYTNQLNHSKAFKNPLFFNLSAKSEAEKNKVEEAKLATGAMGSHDNLNKTLVDGDKDLSEPTIPTIKSKI